MANLVEGLKNLPETLEGVRDVLRDIYGVFTVIGDFFSWLGLYATLLLATTMILLYLLSVISPLERRGNYLLSLAAVSVLAYATAFPPEAYGRYLLVMVMPALISYLLLWVGRRVRQGWRTARGSGEEKETVMQQLLQCTAQFQKEGDTKQLKEALEHLIVRL